MTPSEPKSPRREDTAATPDGISDRPTPMSRGRWLILLLAVFVFVAAIVVFGSGTP